MVSLDLQNHNCSHFSYVGVDNWSRVLIKLVSVCSDFPKYSEVCHKKWSVIYNDYKKDKALHLKSGSQRSEKCRWFQLVDEFMFDRANVVSYAHASVVGGDGVKCTATSEINTTKLRSGESSSKSLGIKQNEDMFMERCIGVIQDNSKILIEGLKTNDDMKMTLLMRMQQTMQKMIDKM